MKRQRWWAHQYPDGRVEVDCFGRAMVYDHESTAWRKIHNSSKANVVEVRLVPVKPKRKPAKRGRGKP